MTYYSIFGLLTLINQIYYEIKISFVWIDVSILFCFLNPRGSNHQENIQVAQTIIAQPKDLLSKKNMIVIGHSL